MIKLNPVKHEIWQHHVERYWHRMQLVVSYTTREQVYSDIRVKVRNQVWDQLWERVLINVADRVKPISTFHKHQTIIKHETKNY